MNKTAVIMKITSRRLHRALNELEEKLPGELFQDIASFPTGSVTICPALTELRDIADELVDDADEMLLKRNP